MNATELNQLLKSLDACEEAIKWAKDKDLETAWKECKRSDWMLWLIEKAEIEVGDRELRLIAVKCARQVQHLMKDQRSIDALDVAERFANGDATSEELAAAWAAARNAAGAALEDAVSRDAAWDAAWAAAWDAAWAAAWTAARGAVSRDAAWAAAWAAAGDAAWAAQSDIIREYIPTIQLKTVSI